MTNHLFVTIGVLFIVIIAAMAPIWWSGTHSIFNDNVSYSMYQDDVFKSMTRTPRVRESSVQPVDIGIEMYESIRSRDVVSAPATEPLLARFVDLDVTKGVREVEFAINVSSNELFLAIDGSSLSSIEVKITIHYPNNTYEEYITRSDNPLHRVIINPTGGLYRIKLSIERAWTRAWIQVVTLNNGVASLESMEKQFRYMVPGEARYVKFNISEGDWVFLYLHKIRGGYVVASLWKLPEMQLIWDREVFHRISEIIRHDQYCCFNEYLQGSEYMVVIRNIEHTDLSYAISIPYKSAYSLNLNEGRTLTYSIPYDVEFFEFNITEEDWFAIDWSVEPLYSGDVYSEVIVIDPALLILHRESAGAYELRHGIWRSVREGRYILIIIGTFNSATIFKLTTIDGVLDLTNVSTISLSLGFTQCGQSIYYRVRSNNTVALLVSIDRILYGISVLNTEGEVLEFYYSDYYVSLVGGQTLLSSVDVDYIVRVQAQKGRVYLHLRPANWRDHLVSTPDDSDLKFRYSGDVLVLGITMRNSSYLAQFYSSMDPSSLTFFVLIDSNNNIRRIIQLDYWSCYQFHVFRYGHELWEPLNGVWRLIAVSNKPGINIRISQVQEGDELYYVATPHHSYHVFDFNYMLKSFKIEIPSSKWVLLAAFNQEYANAWIYVINKELSFIAYNHLGDKSVHAFFLQDVAADSWVFFLVGEIQANVSISLVTHSDLLNLTETTPGTITITRTTTLPVTTTTTRTITTTTTLPTTTTVTSTTTVPVTTTVPITTTSTYTTTRTVSVTTTTTVPTTTTVTSTTTFPVTTTLPTTITITETATSLDTTTITTTERYIITFTTTLTTTEHTQQYITIVVTSTTTDLETIEKYMTETYYSIIVSTTPETLTVREVIREPIHQDFLTYLIIIVLAILIVVVILLLRK